MRFEKRQVLILVLAVLAVAFCFGQDELTLDRARSLALAHSKTLANLELSTSSALLDETAQRYTMLPSASLSSTAAIAIPTGSGTTIADSRTIGATLSVTQTVWNGTNTMLAAIDRISTDITRQAARAEYFSVLDSVDSAYYSLLESYASLESADADLKTASVSLSIAETRHEAGAISMTDYLEAESQVESKKTAQSQARRDLSLCSIKLASLAGLDSLPSVSKIDFAVYDGLISRLSGYSDTNTDAFIANVRKAVYSSNPSLAKATLAGEMAKKSVSLSERGYFPSFSASWAAGVDWSATGGSNPATGKLSVTGTIPLDVWNTRVSVDKEVVAQKQAALTLEETGRTIDIDLQTAVLNCIAQARSVVSSQKAMDYAQKYYENKFEMYKLASASVSDLSDASALVSTDTKSLISARYEFLSCLSTIRSLGGYETDQSVLELIP